MPPAEIVVDTSDGFVDFRIPVIHSRVSEGGEALVTGAGILFGEVAEISFSLRAGMLPNDFDAENVTLNALHDGIRMSLAGTGGKSFASALTRLYGSPRTSFLLPLWVCFTAVTLAGDPARIDTEIVKFKLFHEKGSTDEEEGPQYFEMFLNIDLPLCFVELNEKDTEFRAGVLNALPAQN
ncbi:MAG TPA: hypothetical protein VFC39_00555 [Acidobacteriaceae bacterium]|nr:hypothetical protein [Acidobacteriaceae bacterium]